MVAEYRAYVVNGTVRFISQYIGSKDVNIDLNVVNDAVSTLVATEEGKMAGFGIDFGLIETTDGLQTCLIEVNEGFSVGVYDGVTDKDYTDMIVARWA